MKKNARTFLLELREESNFGSFMMSFITELQRAVNDDAQLNESQQSLLREEINFHVKKLLATSEVNKSREDFVMIIPLSTFINSCH